MEIGRIPTEFVPAWVAKVLPHASIDALINAVREASPDMLFALRGCSGLSQDASRQDVLRELRHCLSFPEQIDGAIKNRVLAPAMRSWAERQAMTDPSSFATFFEAARAPRYEVTPDELLSDLASERVRWSAESIEFAAAMRAVALEHPDLSRARIEGWHRQRSTS